MSCCFTGQNARVMQISALNLIIAAQQARSAAPPHAATGPSTKSAAAPKSPEEFTPIAFGASGAAEPTTRSWAQANSAQANSFAAAVPLGSQIDIRV